MNSIIDNTTGLPQLPNGQWWRVSMDTYTVRSPYSYGGSKVDCAVVSIMGHKKVTERKGFFRREVTTVVEDVKRSQRVYSIKMHTVLEDGNVHYTLRYSPDDYDFSVTPETILRTANEILAAKKAEEDAIKAAAIARAKAAKIEAEKKAARDLLLGDYPPKKLVLPTPEKK